MIAAMIFTCIHLSTTLYAQTWTNLQGPPKARDEKDIAVDLTGTTLYVCDKTVLFKSTNSGTSWAATAVELSSPLVVACKPNAPDNVIAGVVGNIYLNTAGGASGTWQVVLTNAGTPLRLAVSPLSSDQMYLGRQANGTTSSIMRSTNAGAAWTTPTTTPSGTNINDITPHPSSSFSLHVWAAGADPNGAAEGSVMASRGVWKSTNLGADWTKKQITFGTNNLETYNIKSMAIKSAGPIFFVGTEAPTGSTGKVFSSANGGDSWDVTASLGASVTSVRAIRIRGGADVYVATNAGIFKSINNGGAWTNLMSLGDNNILAFQFAPNNANLTYATTAKTVWKGTSTDNGDTWTWTEITAGLGRMPLSSVTANGSNAWTVSRAYDTLSSYNGTAWSQVEVSGFYGEHIMRRSSDGNLFASGLVNPASAQAKIYKSVDGGSSYSALFTGSSTGSGNIFKGSLVDPVNSAHIYAWGKDGNNNVYHLHSDGSNDFVTVGSSSYAVNDLLYPVSPVSYYAKDTEGIFRCLTDGLCNGTQILSSMTIRSLAMNSSASLDVLYAAGPTGLRRTTNARATTPGWSQNRTDDLKRVIMRPGYPASSEAVAVLTNDGNTIYYTIDGSAGTPIWIDGTLNLPKPIYDISTVAGDATTVYAATEQGAYKINLITTAPTLSSPANSATGVATNTALSWQAVNGASAYRVLVDDQSDFSSPLINQSSVVVASYQTSGLAYNTTYYWKVLPINVVGEGASSTVYSFQTTPGVTLTATPSTSSGDLCNTKVSECNVKLTWTLYGITGTVNIYGHSYPFGQGSCGPVGTLRASQSSPDWWVDASVVYARPGQTLVTTFCYHVICQGYTSNGVTVNSSQISINTIGDGSVESSIIPRETKLEANYPNPFNPATDIKYSLSEDTHVKLIVYDILGRVVTTLVDEPQSAGYKSVRFDAVSLPSGMYYYRLSAGAFTQVRKMLLLK